MISIIKKYFKLAPIFIFVFLGMYSFVYASTTNGVILDTDKTALLCKDDTCDTTSRINFKPTNVSSDQVIHITNEEITGFAWSEDMGWIVLNCSNTTSGCSPTNGNFKIANDGKGNLSGYAWGENAGWINFGPFAHGATPVFINNKGEFNGWAWAQNYGWIKFDCSSADACVKTDWRANTDHKEIIGGSVIVAPTPTFCELYPADASCIVPIDICSNISGTQSSVPSGMIQQSGQCKTFCEFNPADASCIVPIDICSNISGTQSSVPSGMIQQSGQCKTFCEFNPADSSCVVPILTFCELHPDDSTCKGPGPGGSDLCLNISDIQTFIPSGLVRQNGQCKTFCEFYPSDLSCKEKQFCELNPSDPKCLVVPLTLDINQVAVNAIEAMKTPVGRTVTGIITAIGLISGAAISIATLMFANPLTFSELFLIPLRLWSLILAALGIKKRSRPWGTVYDSITKQPLDPAYVVLQDLNGNEVATSITDLDGRYGFLVPSGQYRLLANKTNYEFPSRRLSGKIEDELYQDLYFNEILNIKEGEVITKNIPMDPLKFDWNEFAKKDQKLMKFFSKRDVFIARLSNFLFIFGFFWTTIAVLVTPKVYNIIIFCIYGILYALKHTVLKRSPSGTITENGEPLSFAIIRVFSVEAQHEIIHKVADKTGKYYCLIPNGNYYVKIEKKNVDGSYTLVYTSNPIEVRKGYIGDKFKI